MGNSFDNKAAGWDDNPRRIKLVEKVWKVLDRQIDFSGINTAMDYGCGTGLLGYKFIDKVSSLTFCDTSEGMLEQVEKKKCLLRNQKCKFVESRFEHRPTSVRSF